ncbi:MAB_1171c family putative transporter [Actinoplanes derwentensis]|uniref:DUF6545 domain-containing protein n=1 Tax=Actinoplanes derwentensis TaxID=113562 RepID=A0A1H2CX04_9ACTN|nr:MAB_1171c family putative transporter [Actinoplanes derwentensis]GID82078.1 hypothetical protein Ade03nite_10020 [Actinoplanes derwentensis]SDT74566.1 hypothetical protein SAMN04489716_7021 [Actinoplanes derwentensis]
MAAVSAFLVAFICLAQKLMQLRRDPRNPSLRHICVMLAALSAAVLINWEPIYTAIDRVLLVPNVARYLMHILALVAAASIQSVFLHLNSPDRAFRRVACRWVILGFALILMGIAFSTGNFDVEAPRDFAERYATNPAIRYYMLGYLAYLALAMTDILRMSMRYARQLEPSPLRLGIRLLTAGSGVGLAYVLQKAAYIVIMINSNSPPWREDITSLYLTVLGIVLVAAGVSVAPITRFTLDTWRWPRRYRLHRQLEPLWQAILDVNADMNLTPPRRLPLPGQIDLELYRRVIEIRDGIGDLNRYTDAGIGAKAAARAEREQLTTESIRAVSDAAAIAHAITYMATTPTSQRQPVPAERTHIIDQSAADDHETDARWLAKVTQAYTCSPIVASLRDGARARS